MLRLNNPSSWQRGPPREDTSSHPSSIESVIMTVRYLSGLPTHIRSGRVLMHNNVLHGPNWTSGLNGFRYWTDSRPPDGFVLCPCGCAFRVGPTSKKNSPGRISSEKFLRMRGVPGPNWKSAFHQLHARTQSDLCMFGCSLPLPRGRERLHSAVPNCLGHPIQS
jgi:hypothetical protein